MKTRAILKRFAGVPIDLPAEPAVLLTQWHLWRSGDAVDARAAKPGIKGDYPVNVDRLRRSLDDLGNPSEAYLNMEFGAAALEIRVGDGYGRDACRTLAHIGRVADLCRAHGTEILGHYQAVYTRGEPADDWFVWSLTGRPREIVIDLYGTQDIKWLARQVSRLTRAAELAQKVGGTVTAFVGPWIGGNRRTLGEWRRDLETVRRFAWLGVETLVFWADGGRLSEGEAEHDGVRQTPYAEIAPYLEAFAAEMRGAG